MIYLPEFQGRYCFKVEQIEDRALLFYLDNDTLIRMEHQQDCCESVYLADIVGSLSSFTDSVIIDCVEKINADPPERSNSSATWTFYTFRTSRGYVDLRWIGESNGYYSESVDFTTDNWDSPIIPPETIRRYPEYSV